MNRISACLITLNEEHNLPRALASLAGIADEIVVVDSGSTDRTEEIAQEYGAKLFFREWSSYGEQRNFAAECATNEWILSMAPDEELSSELHTSLLKWKNSPAEISGVRDGQKSLVPGGVDQPFGLVSRFSAAALRSQRSPIFRDYPRNGAFCRAARTASRRFAALHGALFRTARSESR